MKQYPVAIITGASRGIGKSCAFGLAQAGYQIVLREFQLLQFVRVG